MQEPQNDKIPRSKKIKDQDTSKALMTPQRHEPELLKTPLLRDLSPFSPVYRTIKRSHDTIAMHGDFAMIETPLANSASKSIIQQAEGRTNEISKLLLWQEDQEDHNIAPQLNIQELISEDSYEEEKQQIKQKSHLDILPINPFKVVQKKAQSKNISLEPLDKPKQKTKKVLKGEEKKGLICNCKRTKCLKLYCDCFREGRGCGPQCNCLDCHNTDNFQEERGNAILSLMERNPEAFKPKLEAQQHAKGCHCKKSGCQKKYCECYQAGMICGEYCKCEECKNCKDERQTVEKSNQDLIIKILHLI